MDRLVLGLHAVLDLGLGYAEEPEQATARAAARSRIEARAERALSL